MKFFCKVLFVTSILLFALSYMLFLSGNQSNQAGRAGNDLSYYSFLKDNSFEYFSNKFEETLGTKESSTDPMSAINEITINYENESDIFSFSQWISTKLRGIKTFIFNLIHYNNKIVSGFESKASIILNNNIYTIKISLPITNYKNIDLTIKKNDVLLIQSRAKNSSNEDAEYFSLVNSYILIDKLIILPNDCDVRNAKAFYGAGIIEITIPKIKINNTY